MEDLVKICGKGPAKLQARRWTWTLNNYTSAEELSITNADTSIVRFTIFGHEIAPETKTPHLQGYSEFKKPMTMAGVKRLFGSDRFHLDTSKGNAQQNIAYCSKGSDIVKIGSAAKAQDEKYEALVAECKKGADIKDLTMAFPEEVIRNRNAVMATSAMFRAANGAEQRRQKWTFFKLLKWETKLMEELKECKDERKIFWVYDKVGGAGKSTFAEYLEDTQDGYIWNAAIIAKDVAHALSKESKTPNYIVFDLTRQRQGMIDYSIMEAITRGRICSGKYDSGKVFFDHTIRVICMANWMPEIDKVSIDRWHIMELNGQENEPSHINVMKDTTDRPMASLAELEAHLAPLSANKAPKDTIPSTLDVIHANIDKGSREQTQPDFTNKHT